MTFTFNRNNLGIRDVYQKTIDEDYVVDDSYQRRKVWTDKDKTRLIETILLNSVIPEVFLWPAELDPETGRTITHIVDGQQRISSIVDFIAGNFSLKTSALLNNSIKERYGNMKFSDLPPEAKSIIWSYNLSIVNIDRECTEDDIRDMFYRLNITDYKLNEQEKRHSTGSYFGEVAQRLSDQEFWHDMGVFSSVDVKRMKDVEFSANILVLADEGIVDQTTNTKLSNVYEDFKNEYPNELKNIDLIENAMNNIYSLKNENTQQFLSRKTQLYTMFSLMFYLEESKISMDPTFAKRFELFVETYKKNKNDISESDVPDTLRHLFKLMNSYRLASSEGVNKISNRTLRFGVLKKIHNSFEEIRNQDFIDLMSYFEERERS